MIGRMPQMMQLDRYNQIVQLYNNYKVQLYKDGKKKKKKKRLTNTKI